MAKRWTSETDGWQSRSGNYRLLVLDTGKPRFDGAARHYAEIWVFTDGLVLGKAASGYIRPYPSVEAAKTALTPKE